MATILRL